MTRAATDKVMDVAPFGRMYWHRRDGWIGTFHTGDLRGYCSAWSDRYRFAHSADARAHWWRPVPTWDVITGNVELQVIDQDGSGPSPAQAEAFRRFNADPEGAAWQVLGGILSMYQRVWPDWTEGLDEEEIAQDWPQLKEPKQMLDMIQMEQVCVGPANEEDPASVKIGLTFGWQDEHGIGVRWRNGQIEAVGNGDTADWRR
jgi:hypothetical protein